MSPPKTIRTDPQQDLRSSIHETIAEFNGMSVRPSVVAAANRKDVTKTSEEDTEALKDLLAALAFTPAREEAKKKKKKKAASNGSSNNNIFDSPVKPGSSSSAFTTPWQPNNGETKQITPPTASVSLDEGDEDDYEETEEQDGGEDKENAPPNKATSKPDAVLQDKQQSPTPSPTRSCTSNHSDSHHNPADSAYSLSLPREIAHDDSNHDEVGSTLTNPSVKRCKKFPTVDTNIPGAGTVRSSMSYKKGSVKLPFVHIADIAATDSPRKLIALRRKSAAAAAASGSKGGGTGAGPVTHIYQNVKGVWGWTKNLIIFTPFMCLTEGAICVTAGITTGNGNLKAVDDNVVTPIVSAVDNTIFNPILGFFGGIFGFGRGGGGGGGAADGSNDHHNHDNTSNSIPSTPKKSPIKV